MRNAGHNKDVEKGLTEAKVEIEQALAIGFVASSIESLKGEATVGRLAICVCGGMALMSAPESIMKRFPELRS